MAALKTLRNNLIVLAAVQDTQKLVAYRGRLFDRGSLLGRVIVWIQFFKKTSLTPDTVVDQCKADLQQLIIRMEKVYDQYIHLEFDRLEKRPFDKAKKDRKERKMQQVSDLFRPFFKEIAKGKSTYLQNTFVPKDGSWVRIAESLRFIDLKHSYEHLTKRPLPLELFDLCVLNEKLSERQVKALGEWIKALKGIKKISVKGFQGAYANHYFTSRKLHRLFFELNDRVLAYCKSSYENIEQGLKNLELNLYNQGLTKLIDEDPKQIKWIDSLKPGNHLNFPWGDVCLEEEVSSESERMKKYRIFSLKGERKFDLIAYPYRSGPYLQTAMDQYFHSGIPLPHIVNPDYRGVAFREKIVERADQYEWKTKVHISKSDLPQIKALQELIIKFRSLTYMPCPLLANNFGFTVEGRMRALSPLRGYSYNFEVLEQFIIQLSKGNLRVFQELMLLSGMKGTKEAKTYTKYCAKVCEGLITGEFPPLPKKDPRAQVFFQGLLEKLQKCFLEKSEGITSIESRKAIKNRLFARYQELGFISVLPSEFPDRFP